MTERARGGPPWDDDTAEAELLGERRVEESTLGNALSGIASVTLATVALLVAAAVIAFLVALVF